ncbi:MAG: hypothetical protein E7616_04560 [Ruminococcaceae bacterium]|nr:hypothetical protein [Oscillospiraceae bacterium]
MYIIRNSLRHIINSAGIVYYQAAGKCTLKRDEMQPEGLMICQACGLDKKKALLAKCFFWWGQLESNQ